MPVRGYQQSFPQLIDVVLRARSGWGYHSSPSMLADPAGGRELRKAGSRPRDLGQGFAAGSVAAAESTAQPGWAG